MSNIKIVKCTAMHAVHIQVLSTEEGLPSMIIDGYEGVLNLGHSVNILHHDGKKS